MSYQQIKLGIIGIGKHFVEKIFPYLKQNSNFKITSIYSSKKEKAKKFAYLFNSQWTYNNWREIFDKKKVDAILATGSPDFHEKIILEALEKKIPLFVEKPPVSNLKKLIEILKINSKTDIFVGYSFRHSSSFYNLLNILTHQNRKKIAYAKISYIANKPKDILWKCNSLLESFLLAVAIHPIEMTIHIYKRRPKKIEAFLNKITDNTFSLNINLNFSDNKNALIETGNYSNKLEMRYKFINEDGEIGELFGFEKFVFYNLKKINLDQKIKTLTNDKVEINFNVPSTEPDYYKNGYGRELDLFYQTVVKKIPNPSPLKESLIVYEIIEKIISSLKKNCY